MTENNEDEKIYTLSGESLRKLLGQSYRTGALGAYQTLHDAMKMNFKDEHFENEEQAKGFGRCVSVIETMMVSATNRMMKNENDV